MSRKSLLDKSLIILTIVTIFIAFSVIIFIENDKADDEANIIVNKEETKKENKSNANIVNGAEDWEELSLEVSNTNNIKNILLVNQDYKLEKEYEPKDLIIPNVRLNKEIWVREEVAKNLENMFRDAREEGINLIAVSGYRSYQYQVEVYDNSVNTSGVEYTEEYVALPGTSEHQSGLAIDVASTNHTELTEEFENTAEYKWLSENMSQYGFILRYPKGKEDITGYSYEPWHLRYVGIEHATKITDKGLALEEYLNIR